MPSFERHVDQAEHNRDLAKMLNSDKKNLFNDWVVTACFYSVVHMVEAMIFMCDHLRAPSNPLPRFDTNKTLVKISSVKHSIDLEQNYARKGHELRDRVIEDNMWYFKDVGKVCLALRGLSQSARYDCQDVMEDDADGATGMLFDAVKAFNSWAIVKKFRTIV